MKVCKVTFFSLIFLILGLTVSLIAQKKQFKPEAALKQIKQKGASEAGLQLDSYKKKYEITSEQDIKKTINELFSDNYFYMPVYNKNVTELDVLSKGQLENLFHPQNYDSYVNKMKEQLTPYLNKRMKVGDTIFEVKWKLKGETFTTLAIFSPHRFIYEHMLANIAKFSKSSSQTHSVRQSPSKKQLNYGKADSSSQN